MINLKKNILFMLFFVVLAQSSKAEPPIQSITFRTYDADTNERISAEIYVNGSLITQGRFELPESSDSILALEISASAGERYYPRNFTVFLEGIVENTNPFLNVYLTTRNSDEFIYTRGHVRYASEYMTDRYIDRAVTLLERINRETSTSFKETQNGIYLLFNLGRAYFKNCTSRFIDQCNDSKDIFNNLLDSYSENTSWFEAESISEEMLKSIEVDNFYKRMEYLRAKWEIQIGRTERAAEIFKRLLEEAALNPAILDYVKRSKDGLEHDLDYALGLSSARQ